MRSILLLLITLASVQFASAQMQLFLYASPENFRNNIFEKVECETYSIKKDKLVTINGEMMEERDITQIWGVRFDIFPCMARVFKVHGKYQILKEAIVGEYVLWVPVKTLVSFNDGKIGIKGEWIGDNPQLYFTIGREGKLYFYNKKNYKSVTNQKFPGINNIVDAMRLANAEQMEICSQEQK